MTDATNSPASSSIQVYHRSVSWFHSLRRYVQETDTPFLNLSHMELRIEEVSAILDYLADSEISELDLSNNNLQNQIRSVSNLLTKTKIRKLNISSCHLVEDDILSLTEILKDTQITDLNISKNNSSFFKDVHAFISNLVRSRLTALNLGKCALFGRDEEALSFIQELCNTPLTHLNVDSVFATLVNYNTLLFLLSSLKFTSITHLNLSGNWVGRCNLETIHDDLRDSKLVELDLSRSMLDDLNVDTLCQALAGTKITTLNLGWNFFNGDNNLGRTLPKTQITNLDLGGNVITEAKMFSFPHFLEGSSVVSLKLDNCDLTDAIGERLMSSLKFSKLTDLDVSSNNFSRKTLTSLACVVKHRSIISFNFSNSYNRHFGITSHMALSFFGEQLVASKLKHVDFSGSFCLFRHEDTVTAEFFENITRSSVTSLNMSSFGIDSAVFENISPFLTSSQLTHIDLSCNSIEGGVQALAATLKFTAITHLNLMQNNLSDQGTEVLAECLKETHILNLNLSRNNVTNHGAAALAVSLRGSEICELKLSENQIENSGLEALAEFAETSLITVLEVCQNPGNAFPVETAVWNNRRLVRQLVSVFKRIESGGNSLRFEDAIRSNNVDTCLKECLNFYRIVLEHPSAVSILAQEENIELSKDQISALLFDEFPKQFTWFVASKIEADVSGHVSLLKTAEDFGLRRIVELLLLNRPLYTIDKSHSIMHPYVYKLLIKYQLPICNLDVEPQCFERIINYFTMFANTEDAADVIKMLNDIRPS